MASTDGSCHEETSAGATRIVDKQTLRADTKQLNRSEASAGSAARPLARAGYRKFDQVSGMGI